MNAPDRPTPLTILVADDDPIIRLLIEDHLSGLGHAVVQARCGREAVAILQTQAIDLVLLDLVMPDGDGFEVLRMLDETHDMPWRPVIVISSHHEETLVLRALEAGADDYLTKPVHHRILSAKIHNFQHRIAAMQANRRLLGFVEQQNTELKERIERELQIAARIQSVLLTGNTPTDPNGLALAFRAEAAKGANGDFVDVFTLTEDTVDVVLGDVMGKGVLSALMGAEVKQQVALALVAELARAGGALPSPQDLVNAVHRTLTPKLIALDSFVTLAYLRLDLRRRRACVVSCGHLPVLLLTAEGPQLLGESQLPIGILADEVYTECEHAFSPGDALVLCSDGVIDARSASGELYGFERMAQTAHEARRFCSSAGGLLESIRHDIHHFGGDHAVVDDLTLLVLQTPADGLARLRAVVPRRLDQLTPLRHRIGAHLQQAGAPEALADWVNLVVVELFTNIVRHSEAAFDDTLVELSLALDGRGARFVLESSGPAFDAPTEVEAPEIQPDQEGGYGLPIVHALTQDLTMQHHRGINRVSGWVTGP